MNLTLDPNSQHFVENLVAQGRYSSDAEAVTDGLHLLAEREQKWEALRKMINDAIEDGGERTEEEVDAVLEAAAEQQRARGIPE